MNQTIDDTIDQSIEESQKQGRADKLTWLANALLIAEIFLFIWFNLLFVMQWIAGGQSFFYAVKHVYNTSTLISPPVFFIVGLSVIMIYWAKQKTQPILLRFGILSILCAVLLFGARVYATHYEPHNLQINTIPIESSKIKQQIRLLHISDIQTPKIGWYEKWVFELINTLQPDLILHTGDLLQPIPPQTYDSEAPKIARLIRSLDAPLGIYGVYGDTDLSLHRFDSHDLGGYKILEDDNHVIEIGDTQLNILGLSLNSSAQGNMPLLHKWLKESDEGEFRIVYGHRPDYLMNITEYGIDLCLAGHTHGGQVVVPFVGPLVTASHVPNEWARGFHKVGKIRFNVSAGIGSEHDIGLPSIRVNCPPEITLFQLLPAK